MFVGGLTRQSDAADDNGIIDDVHPVVQADAPCPTGNCGELVDTAQFEDLDGWGLSSHGFFNATPSDTQVVLGGPDGSRPVLVEYPHGQGTVLASMTTTEWRYVGGFDDSHPRNPKLLANELALALNPTNLTLTPEAASGPAVEGLWHRVDVQLVDDGGSPIRFKPVELSVEAGPNAGVVGRCAGGGILQFFNRGGPNSCLTGLDGRATFVYQYQHPTGAELGTDQIQAVYAPMPAVATATMTWQAPADYTAMGDSYSSGVGAGDYFGEPEECLRSLNAYATKFAPPDYTRSIAQLSLDTGGLIEWQFVACQGALVRHLLDRDQFGAPAQIKHLDPDVNVVSVTAGGNDAGFEPVLRSCAFVADCSQEEFPFTDGEILQTWAFDQVAALEPDLVDAYEQIVAATGGQPLFVLGYPEVFPDSTEEQECLALFPYDGITQAFFKAVGEDLNEVIASAAAQAGVHFVDVTDHFDGHEACGEDDEWIKGGRLLDEKESFHPNRTGQAEYARALAAFIRERIDAGDPLEPTGLPSNPPAAAAASLSTTESTVRTVTSTMQVTAQADRAADVCSGFYVPGEPVELTGEGFAADTEVSLSLLSEGEPFALGTTVADSSGRISTVVTIPDALEPPDATTPEDVLTHGLSVTLLANAPTAGGDDLWLHAVAAVSNQHMTCDVTPPTIEMAAPADGAVYEIDQPVVVDYACVDEQDGSGIYECVGDLPDGATLDTSLPGEYTFTVSTVDRHGNDARVTHSYTVAPPSRTQLDGGVGHSVGVVSDGSVWAWGDNGRGQLGDGTTDDSTVPVPVTGLPETASVAAGAYHNLAVAPTGTVHAWGYNAFGQLGDGTTDDSSTPVAVSGVDDAVAVAAGNYHSLAVAADGTVWAWGNNSAGQLGVDTTTTTATPVQVDGLTDVVQVAAGGLPGWAGHSLALQADGTVWAWGYNKSGQLGDGTSSHKYTPVQISGVSDVIAIAADGDNSYALAIDGSVWAWGDNSYDQLGNPDAKKKSEVPVQVQISEAVAIGAGGTHALAVTQDGTAWAWGNNNTGQLGHGICGPGTPKTVQDPVQVADLTDVGLVAGGYVHSLATTGNSSGWGWGRNAEGQLGDGTTTTTCEPVAITGLPD